MFARTEPGDRRVDRTCNPAHLFEQQETYHEDRRHTVTVTLSGKKNAASPTAKPSYNLPVGAVAEK